MPNLTETIQQGQLMDAVKEWRDSRQIIFDTISQSLNEEHWNRLSNAEHRLMKLARDLP